MFNISNLFKSEKQKRIEAAINRAKPQSNPNRPETAQQSIPFKQMYKDGVCRLSGKHYNKVIKFFDITYQLAQCDIKETIFAGYCEFLNYFDPSISVQFSFLNKKVDVAEFKQNIEIEEQDDDFNDIRREYTNMMKEQLAKGNNGLVRTKYIVFGADAQNYKDAKLKLEQIQSDIIANFKAMGVLAFPLNGTERLEALHSAFNPDFTGTFRFKWNDLIESGMSPKDVIAPSSFEFGSANNFKMAGKIGTSSFVSILAGEMDDRMLAELLSINEPLLVSMHVDSFDKAKAVKKIKSQLSNIDKVKIDMQKKASQGGYDPNILPPELKNSGEEAEKLLNELQSNNERYFQISILVTNFADTKKKLENVILRESGIAQKYNCQLKRLDYEQENGLFSSVPLGYNKTYIERGVTTTSAAIFIPFTTQELFQTGEALYYGVNALSNNLIMCDRKLLKNLNGLFLGTPGSGKSFSAKREITNSFLITKDDIIICDPEAEYAQLVNELKGQVVKISPSSGHHINPLDIDLNVKIDEDPIAIKSDFIVSLTQELGTATLKTVMQEGKPHNLVLLLVGVAELTDTDT